MNKFLTFFIGKYKKLKFTVIVSETNLPEDITSHTFVFSVKRSTDNADDDAVIRKTLADGISIISGSAGTGQIDIAPADTETLPLVDQEVVWDLQIIRSGNPEIIDWGKGILKVPVTLGI